MENIEKTYLEKNTNIIMHIHIYIYIHIYSFTYLLYIYIDRSIFISIYMFIYIYVCIPTYVYMQLYRHVYIHIITSPWILRLIPALCGGIGFEMPQQRGSSLQLHALTWPSPRVPISPWPRKNWRIFGIPSGKPTKNDGKSPWENQL